MIMMAKIWYIILYIVTTSSYSRVYVLTLVQLKDQFNTANTDFLPDKYLHHLVITSHHGVSDHITSVNDHITSVNDHITSVSDHITSVNDHITSANDHIS